MKILFVAYGGGHIAALAPIIKQLKYQRGVECVVLALTTAQDFLKKEGIEYFSYANFPFPPTQYILDKGEELLSQLNIQNINREESIAYLGWNFVELQETYGLEKARSLYEKNGRSCFYPFFLMKRVIEELNIDFVVSTNAPRSEKAAIEAASSLGIPSLCVVDTFAKHEIEWISKLGFASKVCVISQSVKNDLIALGRPAKDILVTGNPAFDAFYSPFSKEKVNIFKKNIGISAKAKIILFASNPESEVHPFNGKKGDVDLPKKVLNKLIKFIDEKEEYHLIFRPHPSEKLENDIFMERVTLDKEFDLRTVLHAADIVVTISSTVGVQAQIINKPLISMNFSIYADDMSYETFGSVIKINSLEELEKAIVSANTNQKEESDKIVHKKNATQRIIEAIINFQKKS